MTSWYFGIIFHFLEGYTKSSIVKMYKEDYPTDGVYILLSSFLRFSQNNSSQQAEKPRIGFKKWINSGRKENQELNL